MDFGKYKNNLFDYLKIMGIEAHRGLVRCINPAHDDHNPSCELWEDHFKCYSGSCGCSGDIYDAVELLEGITDKAEQFKHLEKIFGGSFTPKPVVKKSEDKEEKPKFTPEPESVEAMDKYLDFGFAPEEALIKFLSERCTKSTKGEFTQYSEEIIENLKKYFGYWPGMDIALKEIGNNTIYRSGIPTKPNANGQYAWAHSGLVLKIGNGYKLHFYNEGQCDKRGSLSCQTFPTPNDLEDKLQDEGIVLVEGEMDAVVCRAAGFHNVFSVGGTNGLTKPKIKKHLLNVKKITILFDNDSPGRIAAGLQTAIGTTSLPEKFLQAGYTGNIYCARLEEYKDPDECICYRRADLIQKAIENAEPFQKAPQQIKQNLIPAVTLKRLVKALQSTKITKKELDNFYSALLKVSARDKESKQVFLDNGITQRRIDNPSESNVEASYIHTVAAKYLSYYWQRKFVEFVKTESDLDKESKITPILPIDYKSLEKDANYARFVMNHGETSAALLIERVLKNRFIYIEDEKKYYFFNGHIWERKSDVLRIVYNILFSIIVWHENTGEKDKEFYKNIGKLKSVVEQRKFLTAVAKNFSELPSIFRESVTFDGPQIQETLTLEDGVLDFSGKQLKVRSALPNEYRLRVLPYKVDDVMLAEKPGNFLKFMHSNFKNEDTLKTLFYYLSLIPSRCAQYKVGGIFIGTGGTGKTTTMKIISDLYPKMTTPIPRQIIMLNKDIRNYSGGAQPEIAELEGMGAGISDETQRNDMLNSAVFKQLTGGGVMKARRLYANAKEFKPTAQTIILTNYLPRFDNKDPATIDRMVVIPFSVTHKRGEDKDFKDENDIFELLRPEYPGIVKLFAEYYIHLKNDYKGKIPLSKECQSYKDDYVEDQATDLDRFVKENIEFIKDENVFTKVKDLYARYCEINDIELNEKGQPVDKDAWTQNKLTHFLKSDYTEIHIKQKRFGGAPEQIIINMRLKENPNLQKKEQQPPLPEQPAPVKQEKKVVPVQPEIIPPPPTDNPFDYDGSEDENDFDIF